MVYVLAHAAESTTVSMEAVADRGAGCAPKTVVCEGIASGAGSAHCASIMPLHAPIAGVGGRG